MNTDPHDVALVREAALELAKYMDVHKGEIPKTRRGVYLASVREHMMNVAEQLDATGLSRLAWLFLLEDDSGGALEVRQHGIEKGCHQQAPSEHR